MAIGEHTGLTMDSGQLRNLAKNIKTSVARQLADSQATSDLYRESIQTLKIRVDQWLKQEQLFEVRLESEYQTDNLSTQQWRNYYPTEYYMEKDEETGKSKRVYNQWGEAEQLKAASINTELTGLMSSGYLLIDNIRQVFTGTEIKVKVAIADKNKEGTVTGLHEGFIPLETLLNQDLEISYNPKGASTISNLTFRPKRGVENKKNLLNLLEERNDDGLDTFNEIRSYLIGKNEGRIYETYKRHETFFVNKRINEKQIQKIFSQTQADRDSVRYGGDVLNEQLKYWGSNVFSFTSLGNIKTTLESTSLALGASNYQEFKDKLFDTFFKQWNDTTKLERDLHKREQDYFNDIMKNVKKSFDINVSL